ncbi:PREDICTED: synaptonemal complex protein 1 isoform X2 [Ficedula albicollis]|uniref:synaptonemal complex protein 1 isoform X2 n=1 Tax=Ficedula albicollis TaxID=59894 RepID=UPI0007AD8814|nr:PREDICTED: synaptonemal complex protein 1 isoform X2 [Ficedula albicollis]
MEKDNRFKLFIPPRLSAGQWSMGRTQGFNKCSDDDFKLPFDVSNRGEITDLDIFSQQVKLCSEVHEENTETRTDSFSKLYKEAEKIKEWKVTMESELNQKEREHQEDRKIIEAQNKAIQDLQSKNDKLYLQLEDALCEREDLLKETTASRHLCNLLKETCTHFTEKTSKYEQEREETRQLYEELHGNVEISALTTERDEQDGIIKDIQAQLQTSQNKIAELIEAKSHKEEMLKESEVSKEHLRAELEEAKISLQKAEANQKNLETEFQTTVKTLIEVTRDKEAQEEECKKVKALLAAVTEEFEISTANLKSLLQKEQNRSTNYEVELKLRTLELQNKSAELEEMTKVKCEKEVQLEELSETLKKMHDLKVQLTSTAEKEQDYLNQLLTLKTDLEQEALKNEQLTVCLNKLSLEKEQIAQEKNDVVAELKKLQEKQEDSKKKEENTKQLFVNLEEANGRLRNELESLKEKMAKTGQEIQSQLDEKEENVNNLKKQVENKTKCFEELQQENKVLKKKITADSKKISIYEGKVNKLQLEMENMNKQHKEAVDIYQKDIETRKMNENKLNEQVEKMRLLYEEATVIQRETDIRCQHKITEMVALMEKHKNEYDKMVEEKDAELRVYKIKQQKQLSSERAMENELSCLKSEVSSLKEQLKAEIEEKENLLKHHSRNTIPESEKKHKTYIIKTPPTDKLPSGRSTNPPSEQSTRKKQKVLIQLDTQSDSSEQTDLLSIVSEEEMFKTLYKDYPQASQLHSTAPKKTPAPSNVKSPGSALKLKTMRRTREAGWTAISKMDRKRKMKEVAKLFA